MFTARPGIAGTFGVMAALLARGHLAAMGEPWSEGRHSATRIEADDQMFAGANPRGMQGYTVGR